MTYNTFSASNRTGLTGMIQFVAGEIPLFTPMLLLTVFAVSTLGMYFSTLRLRITGRDQFLESFAAGSWFTFIFSIILSIKPGVISPLQIGICLSISIISSALLIMAER